MACGSCGIYAFGKKRRATKKDKVTKRSSRKRSRKSRKSRKSRRSRRSRRSKRSKKSRRTRRRHRRSRRFGIVAGPGFKAQTSYSNAFAPYFGNSGEPFVNASNWWYPYAGGVAQSPQMLYKNAGPMKGPGN